MAATSLYRIDGVKLSSGKQAYGSREMSLWLPTFIRYMRKIHGINLVHIKVADLRYSAASARTHLLGYARDTRTWSLTAAQSALVVREETRLGCPGHRRTRGQGFQPHDHSMLNVGYTTPCSYQITATKNGRDGLARNGFDLDRNHRPPQPWPLWQQGLAIMLVALNPPTSIPRTYTAKPWMVIPVNGSLNGLTLSRMQWQLNILPTGKLDHYTIRALKVWLGNKDDGQGILYPLNVQQLQYRVGVTRDGQWGPVTTRALQNYLNKNR